MSKKRNIGLDFARVAAMVTVWVSHSSGFSVGINPKFLEFWPVVGLEIFFALSGFLVGKSLISIVTIDQRGSAFKRFYINRMLRILPLYYLVLLVTGFTSGNDIPLSNFLFLQNFRDADLGFFPPSWSLPVEVWFYILIPPVFLLLYRFFSRKNNQKKAVYMTAAVLIFIPLIVRTAHIMLNNPQWDFGVRKRILMRMDALMLGVFFSAWKHYDPEKYRKAAKHPMSLLIPTAGILALYGWYYVYLAEGDVFNHSAAGKIIIFTILPIFCSLLIAYLENAVIFEKLRNTIAEKIICGISTLGYSIYLVHFGVFFAIAPYFEGTRFIVSWIGYLLAIGTSILLSVITYVLIEVPMAKLKDNIAARL